MERGALKKQKPNLKKKATFLNLGDWIPQKEIRKMIIAKVGYIDRMMCWAAHSKQKEENLKMDVTFTEECADAGHLELLIWAIQKGCLWTNEDICDKAAGGGHQKILDWTISNGRPLGDHTYYWAASGGHLEILIYIEKNGYRCDYASVAACAADCGYIEILKWTLCRSSELGFRWTACDCDCVWENATYQGHLNILKYLHDYGLPYNYTQLCENALRHNDILEWIKNNLIKDF